jgi:hypothetical protein
MGEHFGKPAMRKVEEQMLHALRNGADWKGGNTTVEWAEHSPTFGGRTAIVRLHGNRIGIYKPASGALNVEDGEGWRTSTTKSRLNALLSLLPCRCSVSQYKGEWRFIRSDGTAEPWQGWRVVEFDPYTAQWNV